MRLLFFYLLIGIVTFFSTTISAKSVGVKPKLTEGAPFCMPQIEEPAFLTDTFIVTDFGAQGDGQLLNTAAFQKAINSCSESGGGVVIIPRGYWLTGPIELKSNVNLHLNAGAYVRFSSDIEDYPLVKSTYEGVAALRCQSPVWAYNAENIAITGQGVIDGNGDTWRQVKKEKVTSSKWKELVASGGIVVRGNRWYPSKGSMIGNEHRDQLPVNPDSQNMIPYKRYLRPVLISLVKCHKILLEGVTFQNSPAWNVHPLMCEQITLRNLEIRNPWYAQNGDGLDLESCRCGQVVGCRFDVGDDAICIKSGKNEYGRKRGMPTELIVVKNCVVYHGHGGFVIGSEMSGGVRNLWVTNCTFLGTDCGLRFKSVRGRGGVVENIYIDHIYMEDIATEAIRFNLFYMMKSPEEDPLTGAPVIEKKPVTEETPRFQNIHIASVICRGANRVMTLQGLPEMPVENVFLSKVYVSAMNGIWLNNGKRISFSNCAFNISGANGGAITNCTDVQIDNLELNPELAKIKISGNDTKDISIKNGNLLNNRLIINPEIAQEVHFSK